MTHVSKYIIGVYMYTYKCMHAYFKLGFSGLYKFPSKDLRRNNSQINKIVVE